MRDVEFTIRLNGLMHECRATTKSVAAGCEVSESAVFEWVNGRRLPQLSQLRAIRRFFGCSWDELLGSR